MAVNNGDLLESAKKNISLIETELGKKLNNYINNENSAIGKLKEQIVVGNIINIKTGKVAENIIIPPEIIEAFAGPVAEKIDDSTISKYSKSKWAKQILSQIAAAVRTIAPIKKNGYTITYESLPTTIAEIGSISAKVTWSKNGNNYESELKWENFSQKTLEEYFNSLTQLNNVLWKEFAKQLILDSAKVVKALYGLDKNQSLLKQVFGNKILKSATKEKIISEVKKYIEKVSSNSNEILNIIKNYQTTVKKYTDFENAVNKNNDIHKSGQAFIDACNDVEKSLGMSLSTLPGGDAPEGLTYNFDRTAVTVSAAYGTIIDPVGYDKTVQVINASSRSKAITIIGNEKNNTIYGGYGNDSITGSTGADKLIGNYGNDTIVGGAGNDCLTGGAGKDIFVYSNGDGKDTIADYVEGEDKISITSGKILKAKTSGKNAVFNIGKGNITVKNGKGKKITFVDDNDHETVYLNGVIQKVEPVNIVNGTSDISIGGTDWNDNIHNGYYDDNDPSSYFYAQHVTIDAGNGDDFVSNVYSNSVSINTGSGDDSVFNRLSNSVTIDAGSGDDLVENYQWGSYSLIKGGSGNDQISSRNSDYSWGYDSYRVSIEGGEGDDKIRIRGNHSSFIKGETGDDNISNISGNYTKISGGAGNDLISLTNAYHNTIQYASGDGKDTIYGFNSDDTLQITKGSYKVSTKKNDVIVKVGTGKIILKGSVGEEISIQDSKGNVTTKIYGSSSANVTELFAENNFIRSDNLDTIVENNLSAIDYKIDANNSNCLTQNDTILTYSLSDSC